MMRFNTQPRWYPVVVCIQQSPETSCFCFSENWKHAVASIAQVHHPADTQTHTFIHTAQRDPGVEDINTLKTESVLCPEANRVSLQSLTAVTPGYPNVSFICTAQWCEGCIHAFCWGRLSFFLQFSTVTLDGIHVEMDGKSGFLPL